MTRDSEARPKAATDRDAKPVRECGPWAVMHANDGRIGLASDDFQHDAVLWISGDFATPEQRTEYAVMMRDRLNAAPAPAEINIPDLANELDQLFRQKHTMGDVEALLRRCLGVKP